MAYFDGKESPVVPPEGIPFHPIPKLHWKHDKNHSMYILE